MAKQPAPRRPVPTWPWDKIDFLPHELSALKAMAAAHPAGFDVLLFKVCGVDKMSMTVGGQDGQRATDFAEGRRWVGNTLRLIRDLVLTPSTRGAPPGVIEPPANVPAQSA